MTVATDLQNDHAKARVFARIEGFEPALLQPRGEATSVEPPTTAAGDLECLVPPDELVSDLNLGQMILSQSAIELRLVDVLDSDGKRYWGKLFATARWDEGRTLKLKRADAWNEVVDADASSIPIQSNANIWAAGSAFIGQEHCTFTGSTTTSLTGVTKGKFAAVPAAGGTHGKTIPRPYDKADPDRVISQHLMSWAGRRVALYVNTTDPTTGEWRALADSELVWVGRVNADQHTMVFDPVENQWVLGCISIFKELEEIKLLPKPAEANLKGIGTDSGDIKEKGINLQGARGRSFVVHEYDAAGTWVATCTVAVAQGIYSLEGLRKEVQDKLNAASWTNTGGTHESKLTWMVWDHPEQPGTTLLSADCRGATGWTWRRFVIDADGYQLSQNQGEFCHALNALGYDGWSDFGIDVPGDGTNKPRVGSVAAKEPAFIGYHPIDPAANNGRLYVDNIKPFWDDQGDMASNTWAYVELVGAVLDKVNQVKGSSYVRYSARDETNHYFTIDHVMDYDVRPGSLDGYFGFTKVTEQALVRQVYIPYYYSAASTTPRGPFTMLLYPLLSTGTSTYNHATYDKLPHQLSLGIQDDLVDVQSFLDADASIMADDIHHRVLWPIRQGTSWLELLRKECQLSGYALVWRNGQISLKQVVRPSTDGYDVELDEATRADADEFPDTEQEISTVVNQWRMKLIDVLLGTEREYIISDDVSIDGHSTVKEISIEHNAIHQGTHVQNIKDMLKDALVGRPLRLISPTTEIGLNRKMMERVFVGDLVLFTSTCTPNPDGSGDLSCSILATVIGGGWNYGEWTGRFTLMLHSQYANYGQPYAPSMLVDIDAANAGWDSANKRLTLVAQQYGTGGDSEDGAMILRGWKLKIIERAPSDPGGTVQTWSVEVHASKDYEADGANMITLVAGTTLTGWDTDKEHVVTFDDWTAVLAAQKTEGTWQADDVSELLDSGSGNDNPHRWG